ncbi:GFA family protein [Microbulbifer sp. JMSA003]|uniref:GFA family protein n=1 Tax=Microbulbifer sp. JMSA003 TaxID=3243369 RepID=UPI00403A1596
MGLLSITITFYKVNGNLHSSNRYLKPLFQFVVNEKSLDVRKCYCETCRKLSGADYSVVALVNKSQFKIISSPQKLLQYISKPGKTRHYCPTCFAPVFVEVESQSNLCRIRLGLLDDNPEVNVSGHMWVSEMPSWCSISDNLPVFTHDYSE